MKIITGIGMSACLALALAGCGEKDSEVCPPMPPVYCPPVAPLDVEPEYPSRLGTSARVLPATPVATRPRIETIAPIDEYDPYDSSDSFDEAAARRLGEGTADWAVPLEDMAEDLPEDVEEEVTEEADDLLVAATNAPDEAESIIPDPMPIEADSVTIDFPDENITPDDFGIQAGDTALPSVIGEPETKEAPEPEPKALQMEETDAATGLSFDSLGLDPLPAESREEKPEVKETTEKAEETVSAAPATESTPEPASEPLAESGSLEPPLIKAKETELSTFPEDEFEFFGSLSEKFFNELSEGES